MIQAADSDHTGGPERNPKLVALGGLFLAMRVHGKAVAAIVAHKPGGDKLALATNAAQAYAHMVSMVMQLGGIADPSGLAAGGDAQFVRYILDEAEAVSAALAGLKPMGALEEHAECGIDFTCHGEPLCVVYGATLHGILRTSEAVAGLDAATRATAVRVALSLGVELHDRKTGLPVTMQPVVVRDGAASVVDYSDVMSIEKSEEETT